MSPSVRRLARSPSEGCHVQLNGSSWWLKGAPVGVWPGAWRRAKMMCEVMPTISEDTALSQRGSQSSTSDPDSHFEQLMVNMLDERDRLLDTLRETQESLGLAQQHLQDVIYDRDSLQRQLSSALPQVIMRPRTWPWTHVLVLIRLRNYVAN
ncbi:Protein tyrosine phosphatase receptor type f polypeptide-interacting protein alpha-2 [Channa argus]|uniref:Protein tyrosine phosphatase receptor type f polypeptide-interacting protein alpha-2 n=1 Tax=Channa argus TaxID=215402 RepID=A0A6G1QS06_CHAAH|nr:Protein tyrosine phosphatase receptor type f polypeptide-interacting protein alpha-2 [Channa argus]